MGESLIAPCMRAGIGAIYDEMTLIVMKGTSMNSQPSQVPTITPAEVQARLNDTDDTARPLVVDVREPDEWAEGHIADARHIPLGQLAAHVQELPHDRDIVLVCHMGMRSERATVLLRRAGFDRAINMTGGMAAWENQRLPIAR